MHLGPRSRQRIVTVLAGDLIPVRAVTLQAAPAGVRPVTGYFLNNLEAVLPFVAVSAQFGGGIDRFVLASGLVPEYRCDAEGIAHWLVADGAADVLPVLFRHRLAAFQDRARLARHALAGSAVQSCFGGGVCRVPVQGGFAAGAGCVRAQAAVIRLGVAGTLPLHVGEGDLGLAGDAIGRLQGRGGWRFLGVDGRWRHTGYQEDETQAQYAKPDCYQHLCRELHTGLVSRPACRRQALVRVGGYCHKSNCRRDTIRFFLTQIQPFADRPQGECWVK